MRKLIARGFVLEFVSLVALIFAVALAWLGDLLELSTAAVVSASLGISVAAYIWALKWEVSRELREKLSLYSLLESIEDDELYERGKTAIEECRVELENLSQGILQIQPGHFYRYLIEFTGTAKHHVRAIHVWSDEEHHDLVQPVAENRWYQHQVGLVSRGVRVERFFILPRAKVVDSTSAKLKPGVAAILTGQERDGIGVQVVWEEAIDDPELIQEFLIADTRLVISGFQAWSGMGYSGARLLRRRFEVERYLGLWDALRSRAQTLSELAPLLPGSQPDQASPGETDS